MECGVRKTTSLNVNKTKVVDFRKQQREHAPIHINGTEQVENVKFLGVHITDDLK